MKIQKTTCIDTEEQNWLSEQRYKLNFVISKGINYLKNIDYYKNLEEEIKKREVNIIKLQEMCATAYSYKEKDAETIRKLKKICIDNNINYKGVLD